MRGGVKSTATDWEKEKKGNEVMSLRERQRGRTWHGLRGLMIQTRSGREINPFTESFSSESGTQKTFRIIMIKKLLIILCFEKSIWKKKYYRYRVQFRVQCCKIASRALVIEDGVRQKINVIYIYIYSLAQKNPSDVSISIGEVISCVLFHSFFRY